MTVSELRTLVDNLDEYIHIPGGIDRLKKMVLHLAVSGQLVPQDPTEGTGKELYLQIQFKKKNLMIEGKLRKQKPISKIAKDEIQFAIPESWSWVRFGEIVINRDDQRIPLSKAQRANRKGVYDYYGASGVIDKIDDYIFDEENLLIGEDGANLVSRHTPIAFIAKGRYWVNNHAHVLGAFDSDSLRFLEHYINSINLEAYITGTAQPKMNQAKMNMIVTPFPSLAEQKRIVSKVDSIFDLIDQLAKAYKSEQTERSKLVASSLAQLAESEAGTKESLALTHLSEIIRTKADAKILRQTILHLAVSGQLVPQDLSEGSGEDLYKQIQDEKAELVKQGKLKKQKVFPEIIEDEIPFVIPESWKWVRLPEIYNSITPATKLKTTDYLDSGKYPIIDQGQRYIAGYTNNGELNVVTTPVTIFGDHTREIKLIDFDFIVGADGVKILEPILVDSGFFYTLVDVFRPQSRGYGRHFKMLNDKIVPLPPPDEQKRIIAKTTQLLNLVTELEKHLEK